LQGWHIYDNPIEGKLAHDNLEVFCRILLLLVLRLQLIATRAIATKDISSNIYKHKHTSIQRPTNTPANIRRVAMMWSSGLPTSLGLVCQKALAK